MKGVFVLIGVLIALLYVSVALVIIGKMTATVHTTVHTLIERADK